MRDKIVSLDRSLPHLLTQAFPPGFFACDEDSGSTRAKDPFLAAESASSRRHSCRSRKLEGAINHFNEGALLANDQPLGLGHFEIITRLAI